MSNAVAIRIDPHEAPIRLYRAVVKTVMEDLGCTGKIGGVGLRARDEEPDRAQGRASGAARFIQSKDFELVCILAGFHVNKWRTASSKQAELITGDSMTHHFNKLAQHDATSTTWKCGDCGYGLTLKNGIKPSDAITAECPGPKKRQKSPESIAK